jgi:hypothetical protein
MFFEPHASVAKDTDVSGRPLKMWKGMSRKLVVLAASLFACAVACWGQEQPLRLEVKVIGKQESTTGFSYVVPGYTYSAYNSSPAWTGQGSTGYGVQTRGGSTSIPAQEHSYSVRGAVLSLELPDGRIAVVNCTGKTNWTDYHHMNQMTRSCRIPPDEVTVLKAEFEGTDAKLSWKWKEKQIVSLDKSKIVTHKESETYKLIDVLVLARTPEATPPKEKPGGAPVQN